MVGSRSLLNYLPRALIYPLREHAPPAILLMTLMLGFGSASLAALPLLIVGTLILSHYAIRVIEQTSLGHALPPALGADALMLADRFTWSAMFAPAVLLSLHFRGADLAVAALAFVLPAHWLALGTTRSLWTSLNPLRWAQIILVTGPAYLGLCLLAGGAVWAGRWLSAEWSSLLLIAIWLYLLLLGAHLLGYLAYQQHERLGIGVQVERPDVQRARETEREQGRRVADLVADLGALHRAGDPAGAVRRLSEAVPGTADAHRFHEALYERLKLTAMRGLALTQAARLITLLLDRRLLDRALQIVENALDRDPQFRLESVLQYPPLAERALQSRQYALLARLIESAEGGFSADPGLRLLDLVRVRERFDHHRDEAGAQRLLDALGPLEQHPQSTALRAYAQALALAPLRAEPHPPGGAANPSSPPPGPSLFARSAAPAPWGQDRCASTKLPPLSSRPRAQGVANTDPPHSERGVPHAGQDCRAEGNRAAREACGVGACCR